jgi:hypothetical protein
MNAREAIHGCYSKGEPPFKGRFPHSRPKRHGQGLPNAHQGSHSMTWGPGLTRHASWPEARRRQIVAQGACNRPAVTRPSTFAATSSREGESSHKERATALRLNALPPSPQPAVKEANRRTRSMQPPRGCTPRQLRYNRCSNLWHGGLGPHVIHPACRFLGVGKLHRRSRQYRASSKPSQKTKKINFQNRCSDSRYPTHGPTKTLSTEVTGQSAAGAGVAVGVTIGGPAVTASMGAQEQRVDRQSNSGPTCRLSSSPEAGPGATVGTLD